MMTIALFNPSIATENLGDYIIIDSVLAELGELFPNDCIVSIPTQDVIGRFSGRVSGSAIHRFVGGTNLLSSHMLIRKQWKLRLSNLSYLKDITLMGVGWWQYQRNPDIYTAKILKSVLSNIKLHSVRDQYTKKKLESIGIRNVINTGCPTMWRLTPEHCKKIPAAKADSVVITLTDYKKHPESDQKLIHELMSLYDRSYFWPQGSGDYEYIKSLNVTNLKVIPPTLDAFNQLLGYEVGLDYVGTRLHGGVRAIQKLRRALILAVDNRAVEISRDTNLPVAARDNYAAIQNWILNPAHLMLNINFQGIREWKNQQFFKINQYRGETAEL